ncbi:Ribokinase-like protein [Xylariaceae sp. FL0804]|nr:Ribokinase-like protein [Xylariaceae sp. FL0804]
MSSQDGCLFVSLGMVVLDELRLPDGTVRHSMVGGSGSYATLGARLVTEPEEAREVGYLLRAGYDFPDEIAAMLRSWGISLEVHVDSGKSSTRGLLQYHDKAFGRKSFCYQTTPLQITPSHLPHNLLRAKSFHVLLTPEKVHEYAQSVAALRQQCGCTTRPVIIWEPFPAECTLNRMEDHIAAFQSVDVFSPNHLELLSLCGKARADFSAVTIETCAARILPKDTHARNRALIVRSGEHGCFVSDGVAQSWLPPFFRESCAVVNATGGGNTFLGALGVSFARSGDIIQAAIDASVAAGFAIEQIGLPVRSLDKSIERWNGARVPERVRMYRDSLRSAGLPTDLVPE